MRRPAPATLFSDPNTGRTPLGAGDRIRRARPPARVAYGPGTGPAPALGGAEPGTSGAVAPPIIPQEPS